MGQPDSRASRRVVVATALVVSLAILPVLRPFSAAAARHGPHTHAQRRHHAHVQAAVAQASGCALANGIRHVIFIEFDNTHFMRDIGRDGSTNVPSDLEQMPHLLNFIKGNGAMLSNYHTLLISHTSDDITTSETGVYPSRHGVATAANSYSWYDSTGKPNKQSGFTYWTSKIGDGQCRTWPIQRSSTSCTC